MDLLVAQLTFWHWLALAAILLVLEVLTGSSGFLLWIGIAAGLVGAGLWVFPNLSWSIQLVSFAIFALLSAVGWRFYLKHHPIKTDRPTLNRRSEQYIGRIFTLEEPVVNGMGKVIVEDSSWRVRCPNLPAGARIRIVGVDGVVLIGEHVDHSI